MLNKKKLSAAFISVFLCTCVFLLLGEVSLRIYYGFFEKGGNIWLPDDFLGLTHAPNYRFIYTEDFSKEFAIARKTNHLGLVGEEIIFRKPKDVFRILILGDSFTEGMHVREGKNFCEQLQNLLNSNAHSATKHFEVINAGVAGYSPISEYLFFKRDLVKLSPDIVILELFPNDVFEDNKVGAMSVIGQDGLPVKINRFFMGKYLDRRYNVKQIEIPNAFFYKFKKYLQNKSMLFRTISRAAVKPLKKSRLHKKYTFLPVFDDHNQFFVIQEYNLLYKNINFRETALNKTKKYILAIKDLAAKNNAIFFMFYIPHEAQLKLARYGDHSSIFRFPPNTYFNEKLHELSLEKNIGFLDLLPLFEEHKNDALYYNKDGHTTETGHYLIAEALFGYIKQAGYLKNLPL